MVVFVICLQNYNSNSVLISELKQSGYNKYTNNNGDYYIIYYYYCIR